MKRRWGNDKMLGSNFACSRKWIPTGPIMASIWCTFICGCLSKNNNIFEHELANHLHYIWIAEGNFSISIQVYDYLPTRANGKSSKRVYFDAGWVCSESWEDFWLKIIIRLNYHNFGIGVAVKHFRVRSQRVTPEPVPSGLGTRRANFGACGESRTNIHGFILNKVNCFFDSNVSWLDFRFYLDFWLKLVEPIPTDSKIHWKIEEKKINLNWKLESSYWLFLINNIYDLIYENLVWFIHDWWCDAVSLANCGMNSNWNEQSDARWQKRLILKVAIRILRSAQTLYFSRSNLLWM